MPDYVEERRRASGGALRIAGVDEVGRGPLAGPVVAAAVILNADDYPEGLDDSKKLSHQKREALFEKINSVAKVSIGQASVPEIDDLNILNASHLAMERAVAGLGPVCHALIDGNMIPKGLVCPATALVKGDSRSVDRRQSDPRSDHGGFGATLPRLWLGEERRLSDQDTS